MGQHFGHGIEIHFGFAAAGNAVQQEGLEAADACLKRIRRRLLIVVEQMLRRINLRCDRRAFVQPTRLLPLLQQLARLRMNGFQTGLFLMARRQRLPQCVLLGKTHRRRFLQAALIAQAVKARRLRQLNRPGFAQALRQCGKHRLADRIKIIARHKIQ